MKGFFENPSEVKPKLCGPLSSQLEYLSKTPVGQGKPTLSLVSRPFPTPKTLAFGKSNWQRKDLGLSSAILDQSSDGIIQRTVIQSPEVKLALLKFIPFWRDRRSLIHILTTKLN